MLHAGPPPQPTGSLSPQTLEAAAFLLASNAETRQNSGPFTLSRGIDSAKRGGGPSEADRPALHQYHPHSFHGRRTGSQLRSPRHAHGHGAGGLLPLATLPAL